MSLRGFVALMYYCIGYAKGMHEAILNVEDCGDALTQ